MNSLDYSCTDLHSFESQYLNRPVDQSNKTGSSAKEKRLVSSRSVPHVRNKPLAKLNEERMNSSRVYIENKIVEKGKQRQKLKQPSTNSTCNDNIKSLKHSCLKLESNVCKRGKLSEEETTHLILKLHTYGVRNEKKREELRLKKRLKEGLEAAEVLQRSIHKKESSKSEEKKWIDEMLQDLRYRQMKQTYFQAKKAIEEEEKFQHMFTPDIQKTSTHVDGASMSKSSKDVYERMKLDVDKRKNTIASNEDEGKTMKECSDTDKSDHLVLRQDLCIDELKTVQKARQSLHKSIDRLKAQYSGKLQSHCLQKEGSEKKETTTEDLIKNSLQNLSLKSFKNSKAKDKGASMFDIGETSNGDKVKDSNSTLKNQLRKMVPNQIDKVLNTILLQNTSTFKGNIYKPDNI